MARAEAVCLAAIGGVKSPAEILEEFGVRGMDPCWSGLWMAGGDIGSSLAVFESDPERYAWDRDSSSRAWTKKLWHYGYPGACARRDHEAYVKRRDSLSGAASAPLDDHGHDILTGLCLQNAVMLLDFSDLFTADSCKELARNPLGKRSMGITALYCVSVVTRKSMGRQGSPQFSSGSYLTDFNRCGEMYLEASGSDPNLPEKHRAASAAINHFLYTGCIAGVSGGFAGTLSVYGGNEACEFALPGMRDDPGAAMAPRRQRHAQELRDARSATDGLAVSICAHLLVPGGAATGSYIGTSSTSGGFADDLMHSFGACVGGILGDKLEYAPAYGQCISSASSFLNTARDRSHQALPRVHAGDSTPHFASKRAEFAKDVGYEVLTESQMNFLRGLDSEGQKLSAKQMSVRVQGC